MKNIINYFNEKIITNLNIQVGKLIEHPDQLPEFIIAVRDNVLTLGVEMVKETLESMDKEIQESFVRKQSWIVEAHRSKDLVTSLGTVKFTKTLYQNKDSGKCRYLLDDKLHSLNIPEVEKKAEHKKIVEYLYIDADEDHVHIKKYITKLTSHRKIVRMMLMMSCVMQ